MRGKVWLVGAGPGDAQLMTVKGERVLKEAEVVVYDALVGQGVLSMLPGQAECIYVGKHAGNHTLTQEKVNELLLEKALQGKKVVRLKGGDPFLFGRGGEELELLHSHDIEFEVVPGVTSAIAVPAYAGIPVTHRDFASELHIITAHRKLGKELNIDFESLVALQNATLVFMMGVSQLENICEGLKKAGMAADMPAAVMEKGTSSVQRRVLGTISDLPEKAKGAKIGFPGIILVGRVCALSEKFHWAEDRVLGQTRVIVTRPRDKMSKITKKLQGLGAEVLCVPTIQTRALSMKGKLLDFTEMDWMVFTSITAVDAFFEALTLDALDIRRFGKAKFAAVGTGTAKALQNHGLCVAYIPKVFSGEELGRGLPFEEDENILLFLPKDTPSDCQTELEKRGAKLSCLPAYETFLEEVLPFELREEDVAVFTSASTVKGFVAALGEVKGVTAVCIGEQTCKEAEKYGMQTYVSKEATLDSLVQEVVSVAAQKRGGQI